MGADWGGSMKYYKVVVKRTITLTTEINFTAFNRWDAAKVVRMYIRAGLFRKLQGDIQPLIETAPYPWKFETETDSIASIHKGERFDPFDHDDL
jgi:hypothetical protein